MRVLKWMIDRIEGKAAGTEHVFGVSPSYEELNWTGLDFTREQFDTGDQHRQGGLAEGAAAAPELFQQLNTTCRRS
jgi:phosphoenolpyruvate carboxykinase (GTP)